jgi:hypothetical protein
MQKKRNPFILWIAGLVVAAMLLADLSMSFVAAAEVTALPAMSFAEARSGEGEQLVVAQEQRPRRKRRTLMDLLFGDEPEVEPPVVEAPVVKRKKPVQAALPPPKPTIEKAPGATRLAVFGDSLASEIGAALERLFAEDPNLVVTTQGVGSSGFVRPDFFDWQKTIEEQIAANSFDIAVISIGINDRQTMNLPSASYKALTPEWSTEYQARISKFVQTLRNANKPVIWIGLPPMEAASYGKSMGQINELQKLAAFSGGAEYLDIFERFVSEEGGYTAFGPDLNGNRVRMRKDDGIHYSAAGADKLAFYLSQTLRLYYRGGGGVGIEVADALQGTEAQTMVRPPFQGLGEIRLLEVAGAVTSLTHVQPRSIDLVTADTAVAVPGGFDIDMLVQAPAGRVDDFGVGRTPIEEANPWL